ncbi:MAG: hypothetical protein HYV97_05770 [Bdellovibrio sp.]|nr:hypothetical protein [Bdellovibrio sp.]
MLKLLTIFSILWAFSAISKEVSREFPQDAQNKFKELGSKNLEIRLQMLEEIHSKKIAFENEIYDLGKGQIMQAKALTDGLSMGNKEKNKSIREDLKQKQKAFKESMKQRRQNHREEVKQIRQKYMAQLKANREAIREQFKSRRKSKRDKDSEKI